MLDNFTLTYHITILPNVILYSAITPATQYLHFDNELTIPSEYKQHPIDCFFNLYNQDGEFIKGSHEQTASVTLKAVLNTVPLKLLLDYMKEVK